VNRLVVVSSAVALAACVDVHAFPARTATAVSAGAGATAEVPGLYTMGFGSGAFHFPTSFKIGTTEMLGGGGATIDATDETFVGVSYYPAVRFDGVNSVSQSTAQLSLPLAGPSVAKVQLDWRASACAGAANPGGRSTFTFFPDGRITRYDHVTQIPSVSASACTSFVTRWYVTSYTTFNLQSVKLVAPAGFPMPGEVGYGADAFQCVTGAHTIGYGWSDTATRIRLPDTSTVALIYDFITTANDTLEGLDNTMTTTMLVDESAGCDALQARLLPYTTMKVQLAVNGTPTVLADDGIYGGAPGDMPGGMLLFDPHVKLAAVDATVPGGFAVWIDFQMPVTSFSIHHTNPPPTPWYSYDQIGTTQAIFWFPSDLAPGDTITIDPI
jgi:hypothetical protein